MLSKKKSKLSQFFDRHALVFSLCVTFGITAIIAVVKQDDYDEEKIKELLNIEWIIYSITIAVFAIWSTRYDAKNNVFQNPNDCVGIKRLQEILKIEQIKTNNESTMFTIILLTINTLLIVAATTMAYIRVENKLLINRCALVSFYFCVNSLLVIILDSILPVLLNKLAFDEEISNFNLNIDTDAITQAISEEIIISSVQSKVENGEISNVAMNEIERKLREFRNNKH